MKRIVRITIILAIPLFFIGAFAMSLATRSPVLLTVTGFTTNAVPRETNFRPSELGLTPNWELVCAIIAVTNYGTKTISFKTVGDIPAYSQFRSSWSGWTHSSHIEFCGFGINQQTLHPGDGYTFNVPIPLNEPCRIGLTYSFVGELPQKNFPWPQWLVDRVWWLRSAPIAVTPSIDHR